MNNNMMVNNMSKNNVIEKINNNIINNANNNIINNANNMENKIGNNNISNNTGNKNKNLENNQVDNNNSIFDESIEDSEKLEISPDDIHNKKEASKMKDLLTCVICHNILISPVQCDK
jgi:hypothetical protein